MYFNLQHGSVDCAVIFLIGGILVQIWLSAQPNFGNLLLYKALGDYLVVLEMKEKFFYLFWVTLALWYLVVVTF